MALVQKDLFNSPYAGVFCTTNDNLTLVPPGIPADDMDAISEALGTKLEIITLDCLSVKLTSRCCDLYSVVLLPRSK